MSTFLLFRIKNLDHLSQIAIPGGLPAVITGLEVRVKLDPWIRLFTARAALKAITAVI